MAIIMITSVDIINTGLCRPGGFIITDRALSFCNFDMKSKLVDVGCGLGATVQHAWKHYGLHICGIDKSREVLAQAKLNRSYIPKSDNKELYEPCESKYSNTKVSQPYKLMEGDAEKLPFSFKEVDGLLFECSFSKMKNQDIILLEAARVLKKDGYLIISDFYARGIPARISGLLGRVDTKEMIFEQLEKNRFTIELFEDYTEFMKTFWGQMIFEYGSDVLFADLNVGKKELETIKCGYYLIIAKKVE
jgi:arsenite methyltransferase